MLHLDAQPRWLRAWCFTFVCLGAASAAGCAAITYDGRTTTAALQVMNPVEPSPASVRPASAAGWIKTFAYAPGARTIAPDDAVIYMPSVQETVLEADVRLALRSALEAQGFEVTERSPAAEGAVVLSYSVEVSDDFERSPPQSPLRFAPPLSDPLRDDRIGRTDPLPREFEPETVYFDPAVNKQAGGRAVRLVVYASRGDERLWGGFAAAAIGPNGRRTTAEAMARAIVERIGADAENRAIVFNDSPAGIAGYAVSAPAGVSAP